MTPGRSPVTREELASAIAEGVHTGLRKGSVAPDSNRLWQAISDSQDSSWTDAASFTADCLMKYMGWEITRPEVAQ